MTEIFVKDKVDEILKGYYDNKLITCPICRATIDCLGQDIESESNYYICANCEFKIKKPKK